MYIGEMYCKLCNEFVGFLNMNYFCSYCSNLRRLLLLIGKSELDKIIYNEIGFTLNKQEDGCKEKKDSNDKV